MAAHGATLVRSLVARSSPDEYGSRILDAAVEQLALFGVAKSTMDDIANRAGVSRVTVYRRFPNRDALLRAVIAREANRLLDQLDALPAGDIVEETVEGFVVAVRFVRTHPVVQRLLSTEGDALLRAVTVDAGPWLALARGFLVERLLDRLPQLRRRRAIVEQAAELVVRVCQSLVLTPGGVLDVSDDTAARAFARRWLAPTLEVLTA